MTNLGYFSGLMHANVDGLQIHPLNTDKSRPILTSPTNKNILTTGTKSPSSGITFTYRIATPSSPVRVTNLKPLRKRLAMTDSFSLMKTANMMGRIGSPGLCQCLPLVMLNRLLVIFSSSLKEMLVRLSTNPPNKRTARLRRCFLEYPLGYAVKA
jgi:hypothetical protein